MLAESLDGTPDGLHSDRYEENTDTLQGMLARYGFTRDQALRLARLIRRKRTDNEAQETRHTGDL